jgi:hypothetical protein
LAPQMMVLLLTSTLIRVVCGGLLRRVCMTLSSPVVG